MPLNPSPSKVALSQNIGEMIRSGHPRNQAVAASYRNAREHGAKFGLGGVPQPRIGATTPSGLIASPVAGRTDRLPMNVKPDSYVVPADVVSGLGQGNTIAGGRILDAMFKQRPYGTKLPQNRFAQGGEVSPDGVPIITAGGEYLLDPETVAALGGGDPDKGHKMLDQFVVKVRKQIIHQLKKLPGPVK